MVRKTINIDGKIEKIMRFFCLHKIADFVNYVKIKQKLKKQGFIVSNKKWEDKKLNVTFLKESKMDKVKDSYKDGACPDCGEEIPDDIAEGDECETCGHIFYKEK